MFDDKDQDWISDGKNTYEEFAQQIGYTQAQNMEEALLRALTLWGIPTELVEKYGQMLPQDDKVYFFFCGTLFLVETVVYTTRGSKLYTDQKFEIIKKPDGWNLQDAVKKYDALAFE